jgi:hypothetical protein
MISKLSNQRDLLDKKITKLHKKMVPHDEKINKIDNIKITHNLKSEVSMLIEDDAYELDL